MVLPPEISDAIDRLMRADLKNWQADCFAWLSWSTRIVIIGLLFDSPEAVHDFVAWVKGRLHRIKTEKMLREMAEIFPIPDEAFKSELKSSDGPNWFKVTTFVGIILVTVGVAGELISQALAEDASSAIEVFDSVNLTLAQIKAGNAARSAEMANGAAGQALGKSVEATRLADGAIRDAALVHGELKQARSDTEAIELKLENEQRKAEESQQYDREILQIVSGYVVNGVRGRSLASEQQNLFEFVPRGDVDVRYIQEGKDLEPWSFARIIWLTLKKYGWRVSESPTAWTANAAPAGVTVLNKWISIPESDIERRPFISFDGTRIIELHFISMGVRARLVGVKDNDVEAKRLAGLSAGLGANLVKDETIERGDDFRIIVGANPKAKPTPDK